MRWGVLGVGLLALAGSAAIGYGALLAPTLTGFQAKMVCSGVLVSHRADGEVFAHDVAPLNPFMGWVQRTVDLRTGEVSARVLGLARMRAVHRPGQGCALTNDPTIHGAPAASATTPDPWPVALNPAVQAAVEAQADTRSGTRAIIVVQDGVIVAETYRGTAPETPLIGWSMSKSVTSALAGRLFDAGALPLDQQVSTPPWGPVTLGSSPTLRQLLTMNAGLPADDDIDPLSPLVKMMYRSDNVARSAARFRPVAAPGTAWAYSNAGVNLLSAALRRSAARIGPNAYAQLAPALFEAADMHTATFETDAAGTYVGAAFVYAAPRDWARFGQLYLDDGVVGGHAVLSRDWIAFTKSPAPNARGHYGGLFWLNADTGAGRKWPDAPADAYAASGQFGQLTAIIPSRRLVVVRMGLTSDWSFDHDPNRLLRAVLNALRGGAR